jgi:hypothetical protein
VACVVAFYRLKACIFTNVGIWLVRLNVHGLFKEFNLNLVLSNIGMIENTCSFLSHLSKPMPSEHDKVVRNHL